MALSVPTCYKPTDRQMHAYERLIRLACMRAAPPFRAFTSRTMPTEGLEFLWCAAPEAVPDKAQITGPFRPACGAMVTANSAGRGARREHHRSISGCNKLCGRKSRFASICQ